MQVQLMFILISTVLIARARRKSRKYETTSPFGCDCGYYKNDFSEKEACMEEKRRLSDNRQNMATSVNGSDGRIVNGYDVDKFCMPRPWIVFIMIEPIPGQGSEKGACGGTIINKKFVISAAHCFCSPGYGQCEKSNGKRGRQQSSGHYRYFKGTKKSRVDPGIIPRTTLITPGYLASYDLHALEIAGAMQDKIGKSVFKAKSITIHSSYIKNERDQNDIALIETVQPFDFSIKEKVGPICLPAPGTADTGVEVAASGWGFLYEQSERINKNTTVRAECFTQRGGPEEFKECRDWFLQDGEGFETNSKTGCITNREPPSSSQRECGQLYKQHPHTKKQMTKILFPDNTTTSCYPPEIVAGGKSVGWCAVCRKKSKIGEAGYCDRDTINQPFDEVDYSDDAPDDVSQDVAWGYCDQMCHATRRDLKPKVLQEVMLWSMGRKEALRKTQVYRNIAGGRKFIPQVRRELGVAKKHRKAFITYKMEGDKFMKKSHTAKTVWGGSDTCQGDSGGPLYIFDKKKKEAVLVGVVNRGSGCARRDALGIYARVKFHMKWIKDLANSGRC